MYAYNGVKCILAFLTGSQSLSQLDGNCQVFARQLPSKLIRESWLTSPLSNHCAPLFSLSLVKIWKRKKGCFGAAFHCLLYVWDIKCDQTIHPCEWLMSVKLVYHVLVNTEDKFGKNDASFWISIFLKWSFKKMNLTDVTADQWHCQKISVECMAFKKSVKCNLPICKGARPVCPRQNSAQWKRASNQRANSQ